MKILLAHVAHSAGLDDWYREIADAAPSDLHVGCFCVTLSPPGPRLSWNELDRRWRQRERRLFEMYARLRETALDYDVLLLYNGANIHPEFLQYLSTFNVYCCFDDPESSADLSAPAAAAFDAVFYGNIASRFQYEHWGCKRIAWLPIFTAPSDMPGKEEGESLLRAPRGVDISVVAENNGFRKQRFHMLSTAFPQARLFGNGWPAGRISSPDMRQLFRQTKIGWNIHNTTGPINRRLFVLPAFGVLQICDNKTGLGQIFRLGDEAVGFDSIPEAIELTHYYLQNDSERLRITANGFHRFWADYQSPAIWRRIQKQLEEWSIDLVEKRDSAPPARRSVIDYAVPYYQSALGSVASFRRRLGDIARLLRSNEPAPQGVVDERAYLGEAVLPYIENPEMKGVNMARERLKEGAPIEWPNIVALNWAATALIRDAKSIVEVGSGTGPFAALASVDLRRTLHCFEHDDFAREWAVRHRSRENVTFFKSLRPNCSLSYDLLVSLDVFEHVENMREFLDLCTSLAPRAIFSTPNREVVRGADDMGPPSYAPHVREFSPGEFYWILRQYYGKVFLYHMPNVYVPWLEPMTIHTNGTPIIAECSLPIPR